jgi:hypothetical protein
MTPLEKEYFIWLTNTADKYRGLFINRSIAVEQIIEEFLSWYFADINSEKRIQFHELVLNNIDLTFRTKIKMFTDVVNNFLDPEFGKYKLILTKLDNLRSKRNEFAHSKVDSRPESLTSNYLTRDKIHLIKLKNFKLKQIVLEVDILERQFDEYGQLVEDLAKLLKGYIVSRQALSS